MEQKSFKGVAKKYAFTIFIPYISLAVYKEQIGKNNIIDIEPSLFRKRRLY